MAASARLHRVHERIVKSTIRLAIEGIKKREREVGLVCAIRLRGPVEHIRALQEHLLAWCCSVGDGRGDSATAGRSDALAVDSSADQHCVARLREGCCW